MFLFVRWLHMDVQDCAARAQRMLPASLLAGVAAGTAGEESYRHLTYKEEKVLLQPILRLRQACCHPQVSIQMGPNQ